MLSPLPRRSGWAYSSAHSPPAVSAFPERVVGSACALSFSRLARRSLALRPAHSRCHQCVTRFSEGSSYIVTSIAAPVASGWSDCRVGLSPTGKRRLSTAHTRCGLSVATERLFPRSPFIEALGSAKSLGSPHESVVRRGHFIILSLLKTQQFQLPSNKLFSPDHSLETLLQRNFSNSVSDKICSSVCRVTSRRSCFLMIATST